MGATSGVSFGFGDVLKAHFGPVVVTACVDDACETRKVGRHRGQQHVMVGQDQVKSGDPVLVALTVADSQGDVLFDGEMTAHPIKFQPNGPDCPPTAWHARIVATGRSDLRQDVSGYG